MCGARRRLGGVIQIPISVPLTLATAPNYHLIGTGGIAVASDPACPGSVTAPAAAAGHVCVYQRSTFGGTVGAMVNPETGVGVSNGAKGSRRGVDLSISTGVAGLLGMRGTWAATGN
jgi:hypothetical protein